MAVIQISRIQQRRGQQHTTGIPQLSSAELAWAVDTQELYIGNGSVAEGAPYVGNTKILTEHSNIFEDAMYKFKAADAEISNSQPRKANGKLDEYVSVLDFLADTENPDWAATFQAAINDLSSGTTTNYLKIITIPTGPTYVFTQDINLKDGIILRGETRDNVILDFGVHKIITGSISKVKLQNLTISGSGTVLDMTGMQHSLISDVTFTTVTTNIGITTDNYSPTDAIKKYTPSVVWVNTTASDKADYIDFVNCRFDTVNTAVGVTQLASFETNIQFADCTFATSYRGIVIDGVIGQSNRWVISNCWFVDVYDSAFIASHGRNTLIRNTTFNKCGNGNGIAETPATSSAPSAIIVIFGDVDNNLVEYCSCDRRRAVSETITVSSEAIPDVENSSRSSFSDYTPVAFVTGVTNAVAFTGFKHTTDYIIIDYGITIGAFVRSGQLTVVIGDLEETPPAMAISDNYIHATPAYNPVTDLTQHFKFSTATSPSLGSIILTYINGSGHSGELVYRVTYGSVKAVIVPIQFQAIGGNRQIRLDWNPNGTPTGAPVSGYTLTIAG